MPSRSETIVGFFSNKTRDHAGRLLSDILAWDDEELEYTHDYIQWLFPMREASPVNPSAPTVDDETAKAFTAKPELREAHVRAFNRMARFYGFNVEAMKLTQSENWPRCSNNWLSPRNHNMLRITRIITSLRLLGSDAYAQAFFNALEEIYAKHKLKIGSVTFDFWKRAAQH